MSSSPSHLDPIILPLITGETVLDVGCGHGKWCFLIQSNFWECGLTAPPQVDGFDAFLPNVEFCSNLNCYRKVWQQTMPSSLSGNWDTVLACEFIEHVNQEDIERTVDILENAAKKRIIFSTPNWPYYREASNIMGEYNNFDSHLSYVPRDFFRQRGYKIMGSGFGNPKNLIVCAVKKLKFPWAPMLESIPRSFPVLGECIVAYKDVTR